MHTSMCTHTHIHTHTHTQTRLQAAPAPAVHGEPVPHGAPELCPQRGEQDAGAGAAGEQVHQRCAWRGGVHAVRFVRGRREVCEGSRGQKGRGEPALHEVGGVQAVSVALTW